MYKNNPVSQLINLISNNDINTTDREEQAKTLIEEIKSIKKLYAPSPAKEMLTDDIYLNLYTEEGIPLIFLAIQQNQPEIVKLLLDAHVDPNEYFRHNRPLILASIRGYQDIVKLLLAANAIPDITATLVYDMGIRFTPLIHVATMGTLSNTSVKGTKEDYMKILEILIVDAQAKLEIPVCDKTALDWAITQGLSNPTLIDTIHFLLNKGAILVPEQFKNLLEIIKQCDPIDITTYNTLIFLHNILENTVNANSQDTVNSTLLFNANSYLEHIMHTQQKRRALLIETVTTQYPSPIPLELATMFADYELPLMKFKTEWFNSSSFESKIPEEEKQEESISCTLL